MSDNWTNSLLNYLKKMPDDSFLDFLAYCLGQDTDSITNRYFAGRLFKISERIAAMEHSDCTQEDSQEN